MKIGTKSILFGVHAFYLHPIFVLLGWWKLYGFPWNPLLWLCFFLHDLGYWNKPNMDGPEGEQHPWFAAKIMYFFGWEWGQLCLCHSRFLAKRYQFKISKLCIADKMAIILTPDWLYLPMARLSGEIHEYMKLADEGKYKTMNCGGRDQKQWLSEVKAYLVKWVDQHKSS